MVVRLVDKWEGLEIWKNIWDIWKRSRDWCWKQNLRNFHKPLKWTFKFFNEYPYPITTFSTAIFGHVSVNKLLDSNSFCSLWRHYIAFHFFLNTFGHTWGQQSDEKGGGLNKIQNSISERGLNNRVRLVNLAKIEICPSPSPCK